MVACSHSGSFLSVSSNGSNSLQHGHDSSSMRGHPPFSILERIELSATRIDDFDKWIGANLSVSSNGSNSLQQREIAKRLGARRLLSVSSNGSNSLQPRILLDHVAKTSVFQYPRTDRTLCNRGHASTRGGSGWSFSILERIELSATSPIA